VWLNAEKKPERRVYGIKGRLTVLDTSLWGSGLNNSRGRGVAVLERREVSFLMGIRTI